MYLTGLVVEELPPVVASKIAFAEYPTVFPVLRRDFADQVLRVISQDEELMTQVADLYTKYAGIATAGGAHEDTRLDLETKLRNLFRQHVKPWYTAGIVELWQVDRDSWLVHVSIPEEGVNAYAYVQGTLSRLRALEAGFRKILERRGLIGKYVTLLDLAHAVADRYYRRELEKVYLVKPKPVTA